jgi:hypothetical protein
MVSEPGTLKPVTLVVVPGGAFTLSSRLPVAGTPAEVTSVTGGEDSGDAAQGKAWHVSNVVLLRVQGIWNLWDPYWPEHPCHARWMWLDLHQIQIQILILILVYP